MLYKTAARHASELRALLRQGAFASLSIPLGEGGSLPAEMYARVVLDDLDHLSGLDDDDVCAAARWRRVADDLELLREVAQIGVRA